MSFQLAGDQVPGDDTPVLPVDVHDSQHFMTGTLPHIARDHLVFQGLVSADQQLLAGLSRRIEGTLHLCAAERAVAQQTAIFAGKRHPLCYALVDDAGADFGQPVNVGLTGTVIPALNGIVKETEYAVPVILIVLSSINAPLRGNAMRATRRILKTKSLHLISQLTERDSGKCSGQSHS